MMHDCMHHGLRHASGIASQDYVSEGRHLTLEQVQYSTVSTTLCAAAVGLRTGRDISHRLHNTNLTSAQQYARQNELYPSTAIWQANMDSTPAVAGTAIQYAWTSPRHGNLQANMDSTPARQYASRHGHDHGPRHSNLQANMNFTPAGTATRT